MGSYQIEWKRSALKELKRLPREALTRILRSVEGLAENPFPSGVKKLVGSDHTYRIRIGDYRVLYDVVGQRLIVEIIRVGHRRDVYE
ncbi:MAG TPA: type II toxin-antitoxin system RelE/ParE family toxin [Thermoanaerobaculia bacterium]|jgi:mRNA interferase RelE/StbE|nr:type II toxin-antitoxin system RelE/ParE family toxin [Thermoanaerobaculia bacterium]